MDPNQHPSTANWWFSDHKSWGTTIPALRSVIAYNFADLRTKEDERKRRQRKHVTRFKRQISLVCQEIAGEQERQKVEYQQSSRITACVRLAEAIRTQQFWASFEYQNIREFSYRQQRLIHRARHDPEGRKRQHAQEEEDDRGPSKRRSREESRTPPPA